jgi:hypothetical protein
VVFSLYNVFFLFKVLISSLNLSMAPIKRVRHITDGEEEENFVVGSTSTSLRQEGVSQPLHIKDTRTALFYCNYSNLTTAEKSSFVWTNSKHLQAKEPSAAVIITPL